MDRIIDFLIRHEWAGFVPFIMVTKNGSGNEIKPHMIRIIEAIIIAAIIGGMNLYVSSQVYGVKIDALEARALSREVFDERKESVNVRLVAIEGKVIALGSKVDDVKTLLIQHDK